MATTIGNLVVKLTAVTSPFTRAIGMAGAAVSRFAGGMAAASARLVKYGAAAAAAGAGVAAYFVRGQMNAIDETVKLADSLGFTTEQLAGYEHAAALGGASNTELATGFKMMAKNISNAADGMGAGKRSLEDLGLSAQALMGMSPDEQFKAIADAFTQIPNSADRARIAQELFGRSGLKLIPILSGGAAGLADAQAEAAKLGLTFTRLDGSKVEAANDALTRLWGLVTGVARAAAIELSPYITAASNHLIEMGTSGEGMGAKVSAAFEAATMGTAKFMGIIDFLRGIFYRLSQGVNIALSGIITGLAAVVMLAAKAQESLGFDGSGLAEQARGMAAFADALDQVANEDGEKAAALFDSFYGGEREKKISEAFAKIRADAQAAAASATQTNGFTDFGDGEGVPGGAAGSSTRELPKLLVAGSAEAITFANKQRMNDQARGIEALNRTNDAQLGELQAISAGIEELVAGGQIEVVAF